MRVRSSFSCIPPCRAALAAFAVLLGALVLAADLDAASRKARGIYNRARAAEAAGNFDEALELYATASQLAPTESRFELAERRMRFVAGQAHVAAGFQLRGQGLYEEALLEFERAYSIDPGSSVAAEERRRTLELIAERDRGELAEGLPPEAQQSALEASRHERRQLIDSISRPADLVPLSNEPINLLLNESAEVVFETIGKLAGINVLFDSDYRGEEVEVELRNATLTEALDYMGLLTKSFWKPVTHNTVLVSEDNPNKRREHEDEVVKTVYLTNLATPQDLSEITTAIRGLTDLRRLFTVASMNAIVMRGSRAKVAIAEKVIHDMDKPRPEVIVDVLVLETSKSNMRNIGLTPVTGSKPGIQLGIGYSGQGSGTANGAGSGIALSRLGDVGVGSWTTTLPSFQLAALFSNSETELLQSPRLRTADNHQADLRIGDRIPIATGSFQPGVGGVGINPLVNTQFTYTDVGVNVSLTPKIHSNREVSMHIEVEISNVREFIDIGGISQPVIGQRTVQHDVRVQDGEASVIGGLNQSRVFTTRAGVPFLGEIPILGRLFSDTDVQVSESEILLVLIPHIVRMPGIDPSNLKTIASGTEATFKLRYEDGGNGQPALALPAGPTEAAAPAPDAPAQDPTPAPAEAPTAQPAGATGPEPAPAEGPTPEPAADVNEAPSPAAETRLFLAPAQARLTAGEQLTVSVMVGGASGLVSIPLRIQYDRERVRLVAIERGPFLSGDDASDIIFSRSIRHANGLAAVNISRFRGTGGADGDGELVTLTFEGLEPGEAQLRVIATSARDASNATVDVATLETEILVE